MNRSKILITGASGMLGHYLLEEFHDFETETLGRNNENTWKCDLSRETPDFGDNGYEVVLHCAGTESDKDARSLNLDGTNRLLNALMVNPPEYFIYISSYQVYSEDAGENIDEEENTWATTEAGKSKARAEESVRQWCQKNDVTLTIIRPARMFGNGVKGETLQLFNDALRGRYIHIRGNEAKTSIVTALDVAKAIRNVYKKGGIYNAADGRNPRFIEMVEAMTENAGSLKRMNHLPPSWAEWAWRLGRFIPFIDRYLNPETAARRMKTLTLNGTKLENAANINYFETLSVITRTHPGYPYSFGKDSQNNPTREA